MIEIIRCGSNDRITFSIVPVLLVVVAIGASWVPAGRAILVDPIAALRAD